MLLSAKEAGELVGLSKAGVIKALKTGRVSGQKNIDGEWQVDTSELLRVYEPIPAVHTNGHSEVSSSIQPVYSPDVESQQVEIRLLRELLAVREDEIADLRQRLDASTAQVSQLSAVIAQLQPPKAKVGWWQWLLGGGE